MHSLWFTCTGYWSHSGGDHHRHCARMSKKVGVGKRGWWRLQNLLQFKFVAAEVRRMCNLKLSVQGIWPIHQNYTDSYVIRYVERLFKSIRCHVENDISLNGEDLQEISCDFAYSQIKYIGKILAEFGVEILMSLSFGFVRLDRKMKARHSSRIRKGNKYISRYSYRLPGSTEYRR